MAINLGSGAITAAMIGSAAVDRIMLGAVEVYAASSPASRSITYDTGSQTAGGTGYSITGLDIGAADAGRYVIAMVATRGAQRDISAVTIGGVTATEIAGGSEHSFQRMKVFGATVPTGTTATVGVTMAASETRGICVATAALVGYSSTLQASAVDLADGATSVAGLDASGANTAVIAFHYARADGAANSGVFTAGVADQINDFVSEDGQAFDVGGTTDVDNASFTVSAAAQTSVDEKLIALAFAAA